jgi:hypothetical protein
VEKVDLVLMLGVLEEHIAVVVVVEILPMERLVAIRLAVMEVMEHLILSPVVRLIMEVVVVEVEALLAQMD